MTLEELLKKKEELRDKILAAENQEELAELRKQAEELSKIVPEKTEISRDEERNLVSDIKNLEKRSASTSNLKEREDETMQKRKKYTIADTEYRSAWAKKLMGLNDSKFTEEEKRALGDAISTTATEFVASAEGTQGINNGGLLIPTSVRTELFDIIEEQSPFYRDIRKLQVAGNIDLPYLFEADDAEWYTEVSETKNEGQEYRNMQLTGWELAKDIVITWKLEEMAVESFISFILEELSSKMGKAIINAVLYGDGKDKPTGVTNGLTPVTEGETPIDTIIATYKALAQEQRIGAKSYISTNVNIDIVSYKDANGNYPFLQGLATNKLVQIEVDPYLKDNDIVTGNPKYYILNEVTPVRVEKERSLKGRKVTYGGYGIFDGKAKPNAFVYGQYTESV